MASADQGGRLDPFLDHLRQRWDDGCHNAAQLWREIKSRGFTGQRTLVRDWARPLRQAVRSAASMASASWPVPSRRRAAWLVIANEQEIDPTEQAFVSALIARSPELGRTITVARAFRAMVRGQRAGELDNWLLTADSTPLAGFANGLKRDLAAVRAALSLPWSTGPVEGQIVPLRRVPPCDGPGKLNHGACPYGYPYGSPYDYPTRRGDYGSGEAAAVR